MIRPRFGELLRQYRQAAGFSQESLAERARMSVNAVSALERGTRRSPHATTLELLTQALELSVEDARELADAATRARARSVEPATSGRDTGNLPLAVTSFVGRTSELDELRKLVLDEERRLVTLTGPGGVGKSRLALEAVHHIAEAFRDGAFLVSLANLKDGSGVCAAVAKTLRIPTGREDVSVDGIAHALRAKHVVIVLDNCEHVIAAAAEIAASLLAACPNVRIVATSRERLRIQGEVTFAVSPLPCPASRVTTPAEARSYASIELFLRRASSVSSDLGELRETDVPALVEIVRRLDGLPLAIELAVPMLRLVGFGELCARLREHMRFAMPGDRDVPERHQTIEGIVDWSYRRLSERERATFEACSVFVGPFAIDALIDICSHDGTKADETTAAFAALIEKSLVTIVDASRTRYLLLETIRQYAASSAVRSGRLAELKRWHAAYYLALSEGLEMPRTGTMRSNNAARLKADGPNFEAALTWSLVDRGDLVTGARLTVALHHFFEDEMFSTALPWFDRAAEGVDPHVLPQLWADVTIEREFFAQYTGDGSDRLPNVERALAIRRESGDGRKIAEALLWIAALRIRMGDDAVADAAAREALGLARVEDPRFLARVLVTNAIMTPDSDRVRQRSLLEESLRVYAPPEPDLNIAMTHITHSELQFRTGDLAEALDSARKSAAILERIPDTVGGARTAVSNALASIALLSGELEAGLEAARAAIAVAAEMNDPLLAALAMVPFAYGCALVGDFERAAALGGYSERKIPSHVVRRLPGAILECRARLTELLASRHELAAIEREGAGWQDDHAIERALSPDG